MYSRVNPSINVNRAASGMTTNPVEAAECDKDMVSDETENTFCFWIFLRNFKEKSPDKFKKIMRFEARKLFTM